MLSQRTRPPFYQVDMYRVHQKFAARLASDVAKLEADKSTLKPHLKAMQGAQVSWSEYQGKLGNFVEIRQLMYFVGAGLYDHVEGKTSDEMTPLQFLCISPDIPAEAVRLYLGMSRDITDTATRTLGNMNVNYQRPGVLQGGSALHAAVYALDLVPSNSPDVYFSDVALDKIRLLLERGANPTLPDDNGQTPMQLATRMTQMGLEMSTKHMTTPLLATQAVELFGNRVKLASTKPISALGQLIGGDRWDAIREETEAQARNIVPNRRWLSDTQNASRVPALWAFLSRVYMKTEIDPEATDADVGKAIRAFFAMLEYYRRYPPVSKEELAAKLEELYWYCVGAAVRFGHQTDKNGLRDIYVDGGITQVELPTYDAGASASPLAASSSSSSSIKPEPSSVLPTVVTTTMTANTTAIDSLQQLLQEQQAQMDRLQTELTALGDGTTQPKALTNTLTANATDRKKLREELEALERTMKETHKAYDLRMDTIETNTTTIDNAQTALKEAFEALSTELKGKVETVTEELATLKTQYNTLRNDLDAEVEKLKGFNLRVTNLNRSIEALEKVVKQDDTSKDAQTELERQKAELERQLAVETEERAKAEANVAEFTRKLKALEDSIPGKITEGTQSITQDLTKLQNTVDGRTRVFDVLRGYFTKERIDALTQIMTGYSKLVTYAQTTIPEKLTALEGGYKQLITQAKTDAVDTATAKQAYDRLNEDITSMFGVTQQRLAMLAQQLQWTQQRVAQQQHQQQLLLKMVQSVPDEPIQVAQLQITYQPKQGKDIDKGDVRQGPLPGDARFNARADFAPSIYEDFRNTSIGADPPQQQQQPSSPPQSWTNMLDAVTQNYITSERTAAGVIATYMDAAPFVSRADLWSKNPTICLVSAYVFCVIMQYVCVDHLNGKAVTQDRIDTFVPYILRRIWQSDTANQDNVWEAVEHAYANYIIPYTEDPQNEQKIIQQLASSPEVPKIWRRKLQTIKSNASTHLITGWHNFRFALLLFNHDEVGEWEDFVPLTQYFHPQSENAVVLPQNVNDMFVKYWPQSNMGGSFYFSILEIIALYLAMAMHQINSETRITAGPSTSSGSSSTAMTQTDTLISPVTGANLVLLLIQFMNPTACVRLRNYIRIDLDRRSNNRLPVWIDGESAPFLQPVMQYFSSNPMRNMLLRYWSEVMHQLFFSTEWSQAREDRYFLIHNMNRLRYPNRFVWVADDAQLMLDVETQKRLLWTSRGLSLDQRRRYAEQQLETKPVYAVIPYDSRQVAPHQDTFGEGASFPTMVDDDPATLQAGSSSSSTVRARIGAHAPFTKLLGTGADPFGEESMPWPVFFGYVAVRWDGFAPFRKTTTTSAVASSSSSRPAGGVVPPRLSDPGASSSTMGDDSKNRKRKVKTEPETEAQIQQAIHNAMRAGNAHALSAIAASIAAPHYDLDAVDPKTRRRPIQTAIHARHDHATLRRLYQSLFPDQQ